MTRKRLAPPLLAFLLGACLLVGTLSARADSPSPGPQAPPAQDGGDELAPWVRPVQYVSGGVLVLGVVLLVVLRLRRPGPPGGPGGASRR